MFRKIKMYSPKDQVWMLKFTQRVWRKKRSCKKALYPHPLLKRVYKGITKLEKSVVCMFNVNWPSISIPFFCFDNGYSFLSSGLQYKFRTFFALGCLFCHGGSRVIFYFCSPYPTIDLLPEQFTFCQNWIHVFTFCQKPRPNVVLKLIFRSLFCRYLKQIFLFSSITTYRQLDDPLFYKTFQ